VSILHEPRGTEAEREAVPAVTPVARPGLSWGTVVGRTGLALASAVGVGFISLPLLALLARLVADAGEVWLSDPDRAPAAGFLAGAAASWRIDAVPHDGPAHVTVQRLRALSARGTP